MQKINKTNEEWKEVLPPDVYHVTREGGTEIPFTGELLHNKENGMYTCSNCGQQLFTSLAKFDSGTGWPSFDKAIEGAVEFNVDSSMGMPARPNDYGRSGGKRTEVVCSRCGAHLGHSFDDGPTKTGMRLCINSCSLGFSEK